ncbi:hypothetical protein [Escherichia phage UPEC06]|nr:hypothetical protein [Escherichia phage UPEC06]
MDKFYIYCLTLGLIFMIVGSVGKVLLNSFGIY